MALIKNKFLKKFGIVRNAIKKDIFLEEKLLMEEFQDAYQKYKETTKKLFPFIY